MELEKRSFAVSDLEIRSDDDKPTILSGYAAVFEKLSIPLWGFREKIAKGAFEKSLTKNNVRALWNHNPDFPLASTKGKTLELSEDERGLKFSIELPDNSWGKDAGIAVKRGDVEGVSFGFSVEKEEWDNTDPKNVIRTLKEVNLVEISPTPFPAYPATKVSARSLLAGQGFDHEQLAKVLVRAQQGEVTEQDREFIQSIIDLLQRHMPQEQKPEPEVTPEPAKDYQPVIDSLIRRVELLERLI